MWAWMPRASLREAIPSASNLNDTNLSGAFIRRAKLIEARLYGANFSGAKLIESDLSWTDLRVANLEDALYLEGTNLHGALGLTKEQLAACKARGAIIDEDSTTSPSQSTVSPSPPAQSNNPQAPSASPVQVNTPPPSTDTQR